MASLCSISKNKKMILLILIFQQLEEVLNGKALCFDRRSCRYNVDKCRESTGRVVVWREFETIRSYTMESSFCGMDRGAFTVG